MHVDSYLEIFATLYGWAFANIIGELLTGTGLFALPFVVMAIKAWIDAKESAAAGAAAEGLVESIQVKLWVALFVFTFCFCSTPLATLANLSYTPLATAINPTPQTATASSTGTSYDQPMQNAASGMTSSAGSLNSVPMWWYLVMQLSAGFNDSIRAGITSASVTNMRDAEALARMAAIEDPKVKAMIDKFNSECYIPARSLYMRTAKTDSSMFDPGNPDAILNDPNYGPTDVDWMGSKLFTTDSHFYAAMHSKTPVPGFLASATEVNNTNVESTNASALAGTTSQYGWPTCAQWWNDPANGVRALINAQTGAAPDLINVLQSIFPDSPSDDVQNAKARVFMSKHQPAMVDTQNLMGDDGDLADKTVRLAGGTVGTLFTGTTMLETTMAFMHMTAALPMVQALILLCIYMLLPQIVLLSGYKLEVMFYGAMAIFTVKSWTVLWFVAQWVDSNLYKAMYPGENVITWVQHLGNGMGYKRPILNILLFAMFVGFPVIWSGMMTWIGIKFGSVLSGMMQDNAHPAASNNTGMSAGKVAGAVMKVMK